MKSAEPRETGAPERTRGSGRSARSHRAILNATLSLLDEEGYGGLTIEGVAARAGVAKTTIYRWWQSKPALVVAAAEDLVANFRRPDTGKVRDDLLALLRDVIKVYTTTMAGRIIPGLLADMAEHPNLVEVVEVFWAARREIMLEALERGISRGELRADIDLELVADLLYGPIYYRLLVTRAPLSRKFADQAVDAVLRGNAIRS
jgi:AcrR family transcriptional regulator